MSSMICGADRVNADFGKRTSFVDRPQAPIANGAAERVPGRLAICVGRHLPFFFQDGFSGATGQAARRCPIRLTCSTRRRSNGMAARSIPMTSTSGGSGCSSATWRPAAGGRSPATEAGGEGREADRSDRKQGVVTPKSSETGGAVEWDGAAFAEFERHHGHEIVA